MKRRDFLRTGLAASGITGAGLIPATAARAATNSFPERPFKLKYAPHYRMFQNLGGKDYLDQVRFASDQGYRAWEDNGMRGRDKGFQEQFAELMQELEMEMGVFVANSNGFGQPSFTSGREDMREQFVKDLQVSCEVAKRVNAKWATVVMGDLDKRLPLEYQTANAIETLKRGAEVCEKHGLVMVLEPLNPWRDHPGMFLQRIPQAYMICKAVASPSVKILFDIYHQQITEGNIIPNINKSWDEIGYFQIGDTPGRKEPTTGELNYKNIFRHIHGRKWEGILGMEHGNSKPGKEGEQAVIQAYRECDNFEA